MVISMQNSIFHSAGLCDRLRGMCGTYSICKELGLEYKIAHLHPFNLYDYLRPNKVDWHIDEKDIDWDKHNVKVIQWGPIPNVLTGRKPDEAGAFNYKQLEKRIAKVNNKRQIHVYGNMYCITTEEFHGILNDLFKPTEELQALVDWNKEQIGGPYISISTRFQNLLGDFKDGNSSPATEEEQKEYIEKCLEGIEKLHKMNCDMKVLVTSDSSKFTSEVTKKSYVYVIPGEIGHVEYCKGGKEQSVHMKTFLDLLTISGAKKVYQIRVGRMYGGHFSHTAALMGGRPYELIDFK